MANFAISTLVSSVRTFILTGLALYAPAVLASGGNLHALLDVSFAHKVLIAAIAAALHVVYASVEKSGLLTKVSNSIKSGVLGKAVFSAEKDLNPTELAAVKSLVNETIKDLESKAIQTPGTDVVETVIRQLVTAYKA